VKVSTAYSRKVISSAGVVKSGVSLAYMKAGSILVDCQSMRPMIVVGSVRDKDIALVKVCMKQSRTAYALHERTSDQLRDDNFTVFHESKMIIDQAALW
jgi:hypothetical protein